MNFILTSHDLRIPKLYRISAFLILLLILPIQAQAEPAPDSAVTLPSVSQVSLPADIFIKTKTQTFNSRNYYALLKGRIWSKLNAETTGKQEPWALMGCEGLPCQPNNQAFVVPTWMSEISADSDELTAIDHNGRFYVRTSAGPGFFSKDEWIIEHGMPKDRLMLPDTLKDKRSWSMGRRNSDVMWSEDADGNVHHYGTMGTSTIYILGPDGQDIHYTDNGLPTDFSHHVCGPKRGSFVAENLQASASTLFVINRAGEMYTQMNDFDLNGGTSIFIRYSYAALARRPQEKGTDFQTHLTPWKLPLQDWRKQPVIPLTGQARLSTSITILQTGTGNAARELRVAGQNAAGKMGFWFKKIEEPRWDFKPVALQIAASTWVDPKRLVPQVKPQDIVYQQTNSLRGSELSLLNFNMQCSPATLRLSLPGRQIDLKLHTVDAWINTHRRDAGRDGTPLVLLGTLEIPPEELAHVPENLRRANLETFAFQVLVTSDYVAMYRSGGTDVIHFWRTGPVPDTMTTFDYRYQAPIGPYTAGLLLNEDADYLNLRKISQMADPSLLVWNLEQFKAADLPQLEALIAHNQTFLQQYIRAHALTQTAQLDGLMQVMLTGLIRNFYDLILADYWIPYAKAFSRNAPELMWAYYALEDRLNDRMQFEYGQMIRILKFRIERYELRRSELLLSQERL